MAQLFSQTLPYQSSSIAWFDALADMAHRTWLDSSDSPRGRFDILTADPEHWHVFAPAAGLSAAQLRKLAADYLTQLRAAHAKQAIALHSENRPFCGGVIGQLSYDFGRCLMGVNSNKNALSTPLAEAGVYCWAIVQDHRLKRCTFVSLEGDKAAATRCKLLQDALATETQNKSNESQQTIVSAETQPNLSKQEYDSAFQKIREYTLDGDCYQINFSKQYSAAYPGGSAALYKTLRSATSGPFSAFFTGRKSATLSLSPERLVSIRQGRLLTQPIKGTAPRSSRRQQDQKNAAELESSEKNRAENVMIVDLLRNDFGKVCIPGSIEVPQLFELQSFSAVHHLVSSICGELAAGMDAFNVLQAVFPGGSVTGAPKQRAMEIIEELEPHTRSIYCGSLFYLSSCGSFDSNILIRSLLCENNRVYCWGGGGIVLDSTADEEWTEIHDKIGRLLTVLRADKVANEGASP